MAFLAILLFIDFLLSASSFEECIKNKNLFPDSESYKVGNNV